MTAYVIAGFILLAIYIIVMIGLDKIMVHLPFGLTLSINGILMSIIFVLFLSPLIALISSGIFMAVAYAAAFWAGYKLSLLLYSIFKIGESGEIETDFDNIVKNMTVGTALSDQNTQGMVEILFGDDRIICKNHNSDLPIKKGDSVYAVTFNGGTIEILSEKGIKKEANPY